MRKVVAYALVSVDGVAEAPETFLEDFDEEMDANLAEVIGAQDTVLLGRRMCDSGRGRVLTSDVQPFADFMNAVQKYVGHVLAPREPLDQRRGCRRPGQDSRRCATSRRGRWRRRRAREHLARRVAPRRRPRRRRLPSYSSPRPSSGPAGGCSGTRRARPLELARERRHHDGRAPRALPGDGSRLKAGGRRADSREQLGRTGEHDVQRGSPGAAICHAWVTSITGFSTT